MTTTGEDAIAASLLATKLGVPQTLCDLWCSDVGSGGESDERLEKLVARYGEPHRHYHATSHVIHVLINLPAVLEAEGIEHDSRVARTLRLALWYHDAIYDVHSATNEADSAELAGVELAGMGLEQSTCTDVSRLVMATKHPCQPTSIDEAIIVDVDLGILATSQESYTHYVSQVRQEYAFVSAADWQIGRAKVLNAFLESERIFHTSSGKTWEPKARENLQRELDSLTA